MSFFTPKKIYLDYAAATPMREEVIKSMKPYLTEEFYNPSAIYDEGKQVKRALEAAREQIARILHAGTRDVIFTSGGTESDNLAILGTYEYARTKIEHPHIIVLEHEHPAILEAAREAEHRGAEVSIVSPENIVSSIKENTVLISVSLVQSETGEIFRSGKIGREVREYRKNRHSEFPYVHLDLSQAALTEPLNVDTLQADLATLDAAKIYGPKGSGVLVVRPWVTLRPLLVGGGQERGLRSGTVNLSASIGFAKALELAESEKTDLKRRLTEIKDHFLERLALEIPHSVVNGGPHTAPHIVSVSIPGALHEFIAVCLAEKGVLVSTGSSCSSQKDEADKEALRFSFGRETTKTHVEHAARILREVLI